MRELLKKIQQRPFDDCESSLGVIQQEITVLDLETGKRVEEITRRYRPRIVFNMGYSPDEMELAQRVEVLTREKLRIEVEFFGFVYHDAAVHRAVAAREVFSPNHRDTIAAAGLERVARRIAKFWAGSVSDSVKRVDANAARTFERFSTNQVGTYASGSRIARETRGVALPAWSDEFDLHGPPRVVPG